MVIGGSLGAVAVNNAVRAILPELLKDFQVIHLCGKGKLDSSLTDTKGYVQYEYIKDELADLFALADIVISRAGANAICEISALKKPNLLIPLSARASRGDQILNARSFEKLGYSMVLEEEEITNQKLLESIQTLYQNRDSYIQAMEKANKLILLNRLSSYLNRQSTNNYFSCAGIGTGIFWKSIHKYCSAGFTGFCSYISSYLSPYVFSIHLFILCFLTLKFSIVRPRAAAISASVACS